MCNKVLIIKRATVNLRKEKQYLAQKKINKDAKPRINSNLQIDLEAQKLDLEAQKRQIAINRFRLMNDTHLWHSIHYDIDHFLKVSNNKKIEIKKAVDDFKNKIFITDEDIQEIAKKLHTYNLIAETITQNKFLNFIENKEIKEKTNQQLEEIKKERHNLIKDEIRKTDVLEEEEEEIENKENSEDPIKILEESFIEKKDIALNQNEIQNINDNSNSKKKEKEIENENKEKQKLIETLSNDQNKTQNSNESLEINTKKQK